MLSCSTFLQAASRTAALLLALFSLACIVLMHSARAQETTDTTLPSPATSVEPTNATETFADFENGTYDGWTIEGDAFGTAPATDALFPGQITGFVGRGFLYSLHPKKGNSATGKATSREFTIEKPVIRFKIGGGNHPNEACLNLVVDSQIVRTATGNDTPTLSDASWDVSALVGKKAHLEVVDSSTSTERGYILVDAIRFTGRIDFDNLPYQNTVKQMADSWISKYHLPGVWCAYIKDGKVVACVAEGVKNIETKTPASVNDHLNVGSVSKVITGTMTAEMVARGVISYDTKISDVFPQLANKYPSSPFRNATLRDLITHTAGIPSAVVFDTSDKSDGITWRYGPVETALASTKTVAPGTVREYCNAGPVIEVAMLERCIKDKGLGAQLGSSYEEWLKNDTGQRIGLTDPKMLDYAKQPGADDIQPYYISSDGGVTANHTVGHDSFIYAPQGSCSITLHDLCAFALCTMNNSAGLPDDIYNAVTQFPEGPSELYRYTGGGWAGNDQKFLISNGNTGRGEYCEIWVNKHTKRAMVYYTNGNSETANKDFFKMIGADLQVLGFQ